MKAQTTTESTIRLAAETLLSRFAGVIGERDTLTGDSDTFNKAFRYYRAGNCICPTCGLSFQEHPVVRLKEKQHYGCELHVLCNTDRVKL